MIWLPRAFSWKSWLFYFTLFWKANSNRLSIRREFGGESSSRSRSIRLVRLLRVLGRLYIFRPDGGWDTGVESRPLYRTRGGTGLLLSHISLVCHSLLFCYLLSSVGGYSIHGPFIQLRYADTAEGCGLQFAVMSADVSRSDRPKWTGKYVLSWISKMRSYCDEVVKTDIKSEKDVETGSTVAEYDVSAALIFDYKRSVQKAVTNAEYNRISNKIYNRLNYSFGEEITLLASVSEGDGRGAVEKILGTLGSEQHQLGALDAEMRANSDSLQSREHFDHYENIFGRIVKEWRLIVKKSAVQAIKDQKQAEGTLRMYVMNAIKDVFPDVWRDAMKLGNVDSYYTILKNCRNINLVLGSNSVRPTTHFNHSKGKGSANWGGKGGGYYGGKGKGDSGKGKGKGSSGHNAWDHNKQDWKRCDNCEAADYYHRHCAKADGVYENRLQEALQAKREEASFRKGKGKGQWGKGQYSGKGYHSGYEYQNGYNQNGFGSERNDRNDGYRDQSYRQNDYFERHGNVNSDLERTA